MPRRQKKELFTSTRIERATRPNIRYLRSLKIYQIDLRSKRYDGLREVLSNGKKIIQFRNRIDAETKSDEIADLIGRLGNERLQELEELITEDAISLSARLSTYGKSLGDAVDFYIAHIESQKKIDDSALVSIRLDQWVAAKAREHDQGTLRPITLTKIREMSHHYKKIWGDCSILSLNSADIEKQVEALTSRSEKGRVPASQQTKYHYWSYFSQFLTWCRRKYGEPKINPCEVIRIKRTDSTRAFFTPEQCDEIMSLSRKRPFIALLPYHAVCLFAGVRPQECQRLTWQSVDFDDETILIQKHEAKTKKHRRVEIHSTLRAWLLWFREKHAAKPLVPATGIIEKLRTFRKRLGYWTPNGLRHSYASYYLGGVKRDFGVLETNMGNSRTMLQNHYVNFPTKKDSSEFWSILPPTPPRYENG